MAIIVNEIYVPHTLGVFESKQLPYATKELLDTIIENQSLLPGIKRKNYYIISTGAELRGYEQLKKEFRIFEMFISICRSKGYSLVMIKFDKNV